MIILDTDCLSLFEREKRFESILRANLALKIFQPLSLHTRNRCVDGCRIWRNAKTLSNK